MNQLDEYQKKMPKHRNTQYSNEIPQSIFASFRAFLAHKSAIYMLPLILAMSNIIPLSSYFTYPQTKQSSVIIQRGCRGMHENAQPRKRKHQPRNSKRYKTREEARFLPTNKGSPSLRESSADCFMHDSSPAAASFLVPTDDCVELIEDFSFDLYSRKNHWKRRYCTSRDDEAAK